MAVHGNTGGGEECMKQELLQQVENLVESALGDIHTAMLATILEYDPDECTVSVQPFASFLTDDGRKIPYPIIGSVPVAVMKSHGYEIAFPVQPGDVCLLIISEADTSPALERRRGYTDAIRSLECNRYPWSRRIPDGRRPPRGIGKRDRDTGR